LEKTFWLEHWAADKIGFHRPETNPLLIRHWADLDIRPGERVFVPLCGKSLDMAWLARAGHDVIGVELSPRGIQAFFDEQKLTPDSGDADGFLKLTADRFTLLSGDFFELTPDHIHPVGAIYDRAALIALPEAMRALYAAKLAELAPVPILLITANYDQTEMPGPPFAVGNDEVRSLYEDRYEVQVLEGPIDIMDQEPKFAERGVTGLEATIFRLLPR
jgi:thiopurine S-methyltransferase